MDQLVGLVREQRASLLKIPDLQFTLCEQGLERTQPLRQCIVCGAGFRHAAVKCTHFLGARHQRLAGFFEQVFGQGPAGLQGLETGVQHVDFVAVRVVGLVKGCGQAANALPALRPD